MWNERSDFLFIMCKSECLGNLFFPWKFIFYYSGPYLSYRDVNKKLTKKIKLWAHSWKKNAYLSHIKRFVSYNNIYNAKLRNKMCGEDSCFVQVHHLKKFNAQRSWYDITTGFKAQIH